MLPKKPKEIEDWFISYGYNPKRFIPRGVFKIIIGGKTCLVKTDKKSRVIRIKELK